MDYDEGEMGFDETQEAADLKVKLHQIEQLRGRLGVVQEKMHKADAVLQELREECKSCKEQLELHKAEFQDRIQKYLTSL